MEHFPNGRGRRYIRRGQEVSFEILETVQIGYPPSLSKVGFGGSPARVNSKINARALVPANGRGHRSCFAPPKTSFCVLRAKVA